MRRFIRAVDHVKIFMRSPEQTETTAVYVFIKDIPLPVFFYLLQHDETRVKLPETNSCASKDHKHSLNDFFGCLWTALYYQHEHDFNLSLFHEGEITQEVVDESRRELQKHSVDKGIFLEKQVSKMKQALFHRLVLV